MAPALLPFCFWQVVVGEAGVCLYGAGACFRLQETVMPLTEQQMRTWAESVLPHKPCACGKRAEATNVEVLSVRETTSMFHGLPVEGCLIRCTAETRCGICGHEADLGLFRAVGARIPLPMIDNQGE